MSTTLDEIVIRINELKDAERTELLRRLSELKPKMTNQKDSQPTEKKVYVHPNTIWIKENKHNYAGNYVALKDGKLIAYGRTIKEADLAAKAKGVDDPLLHYILPKDYVP